MMLEFADEISLVYTISNIASTMSLYNSTKNAFISLDNIVLSIK
jgi:hypothetical protein